jgi:translation elongation factor EF-1alpha
MPVSEKYKDMGAIAVGKIESGHICKGDSVALMPTKANVEIAAIYNESEEEGLYSQAQRNPCMHVHTFSEEITFPVRSSPPFIHSQQ